MNFDWAPQSAKDARQEAVSAASETGGGREGHIPIKCRVAMLGQIATCHTF